MRKIFLLSLLTMAIGFAGKAQVVITSLGTPYTQNFDGLSNDTTWSTAHPMNLTGWAIFEKGGGLAVDQMYHVNNGSRNNGETYSYGDSSATDRALGSIASASNIPSFGVVFQNNTGSSITGLAITYRGEEWRSGDTSATSLDSLIFEYSLNATGVGDTLATWNAIPSLMFNTPNLVTTTAGALNGNSSPNTANLSGSISALITNGSTIVLRWRDINKVASDDGLAIDDLSISFSSSGNPKPTIIATTPVDNATNVSPILSNLTLTFDQSVSVGTGNIILKNLTDASQQTIACSSATISGATVTIPGITLLSGKDYAVQYDSTCFHSSTAANAYGIYDNTSWNFSTQPNGLNDLKTTPLNLSLNQQQLMFTSPEATQLTITVYTMNGQTVSTGTLHANQGENKYNMSLNTLSNGIYFVQVANQQYKGVLKFEKQ